MAPCSGVQDTVQFQVLCGLLIFNKMLPRVVVVWLRSWYRASLSSDGIYGSKGRHQLTTAQSDQVFDMIIIGICPGSLEISDSSRESPTFSNGRVVCVQS